MDTSPGGGHGWTAPPGKANVGGVCRRLHGGSSEPFGQCVADCLGLVLVEHDHAATGDMRVEHYGAVDLRQAQVAELDGAAVGLARAGDRPAVAAAQAPTSFPQSSD